MTNLLKQSTFHIYDTSKSALTNDPLSDFAFGDVLIRQVNHPTNPTMLHFWPIEKMIILGMMDTKLPDLDEGFDFLEAHNYDVRVRPAGGLAVVADEGILNLSLVFREEDDEKVSIDDAYDMMVELIRQTFASYGKKIEAFEIPDSYCPGKFDLSIDGKKFAGIAQRRFKKGIAVMIYLSVNGDQQKRGELLRDFYKISLKDKETRWHYPDVNPDSMANLSDLLGDQSLTNERVKTMILEALLRLDNTLLDAEYTAEMLQDYHVAHEKMAQRNQKVLDQLNRR